MAEATLTDVTSKLSEANEGLGGISSALAGMGSSLGKIISTLEGISGKISSMMSSPVPIAIDVDVTPGAPAPDATASPLAAMKSILEGISVKLDAPPAFVDNWFPRFLQGLHLIHNDLIEAFHLDKEKMRIAAENMAEAGRGLGEKPKDAEKVDASVDLGSLGGIFMSAGWLLVGFVEGYVGSFKDAFTGARTLFKNMGTDLKNLFNFTKNWIKDSKFGRFLGRIKTFFTTKVTTVLTKIDDLWKGSKPQLFFKSVKEFFKTTKLKAWTKIDDMFTNSGPGRWFKSVKAFFATPSKNLFDIKTMKPMDSPFIKWIKSIKAWFSKKIPFKLPNFKAMWTGTKGGIGSFFTGIKNAFGSFFTGIKLSLIHI